MATLSAHDVAAELRRQLPGLPTKKLHKLLYYCQGHHLAHFGEPLFAESIMAWDMGPVVAQLWKAEKDGRVPPVPQELDAGQLNTVGYVVSRYGRLTGHDLQLLTHAEDPWKSADRDRPAGDSARIDPSLIRRFFQTAGAPEADTPWPETQAVQALVRGADARRTSTPVVDDLAALASRRSQE